MASQLMDVKRSRAPAGMCRQRQIEDKLSDAPLRRRSGQDVCGPRVDLVKMGRCLCVEPGRSDAELARNEDRRLHPAREELPRPKAASPRPTRKSPPAHADIAGTNAATSSRRARFSSRRSRRPFEKDARRTVVCRRNGPWISMARRVGRSTAAPSSGV